MDHLQELENRCRYTCNIIPSNFTVPKNSGDDGFILEFVISTRHENVYFNSEGNSWILFNITESSSLRRRSSFLVPRAPLIFGNVEETLDAANLSVVLDALDIPTAEHAKITADIKEYAVELADNNDTPALLPILVEISKWNAVNITDHFFNGRNRVDYDEDDMDLIIEYFSGIDSNQPIGSPAAASAVKELVESGTVVVSPENEELQLCTICQLELSVGDDAIRMPCQHVFHSECIRKWLTYKNTCPICRFPMPTELN